MTRADSVPAFEREDPDDELMRELAAGRQHALAPLHRRYAPLVFALAARALDRAAAEEIVQDVFVIVWRNAATFDPNRGAFRAWLLQIARSRIANELRRRGRRPQTLPDPRGLRLASLRDDDPEPADALWQEYRRDTLREAVASLPPPQRQALSLAFFEELTHEQVAGMLDVPLGTAKTRIRAALLKLRGSLAPLLVLVLVAALAVSAFQHRAREETMRREANALRLVTMSDVVPLRLVAGMGVPTEAHGQYRGRTGAYVAVLTVSYLPPPPEGRVYRAWGRYAGQWVPFGTVRPGDEGRALLVIEHPALVSPPDAVRVTTETDEGGDAPTGPPVIAWPAP